MEYYMNHPFEIQYKVLSQLLQQGSACAYGKKFDFAKIKTPSEYAQKVPLIDYEDIKQDIRRMMLGEKNVLWPGLVQWYAKSSGTTNDKSKFIPVPKSNLKNCHVKASWDSVSIIYHNHPNARIFAEKSLIMGGSIERLAENQNCKFGDVSAIMLHNMPQVGRPFYTPDFATAILPNFDEKIEKMVEQCSQENVTMIGGVPTWTLLLFRKILEATGKNNILEIWPELQVYVHGGVGFDPYKEQFKKFLPSDQVQFMEVFNASEGWFAAQLGKDDDDMLLLLDNNIYYEFLPASEWEKEDPQTIPLEGIKLGVNYAMVISTSAGLWRYKLGDTVCFTSNNPYKIKITGRTKQYINAFGEEVMVSNIEKALSQTCLVHDAVISEYTVAPIYFQGESKGGHEWFVEFEKEPNSPLDTFSENLDHNLQKVNSDYEAKRYKSMALERLKLRSVPKGTFYSWMRSKGKMGGQNKVPRLANHRKYIEDLGKFINQQRAYE